MLNPRILVTILLIALIGSLLGGILTASTLGPDAASDIRVLMSPLANSIQLHILWVGPLPFIYPTFPWLDALWNTLWFNSALFESVPGQYTRWALITMFGVVMAVGLGMWVITVIRGGGG